MSTRVYLLRHGETELSAEDRFAGAVDAALSAAGHRQAEAAGRRLFHEPIVAVYSSPLGRTVATASEIADPHGLEVERLAELREIGHGRWEGQSRADVERTWPEEYARWEEDPFTFAPEGGESGLDVTQRALPALLRLVERHRDTPFVVVSHKATIRLLLSSLLGFDPRRYRDRLDMSPASLTILDFKDVVNARLTLFNDVSHYAEPRACVPRVPTGRLSKVWSR